MIFRRILQFSRLGAYYRTEDSAGTEQDLKVEKIFSHHSYKRPYGLAHDIALIKLEGPAQINRAVNLACLPGSSGAVSDGKMCWVTGINRREFRSGLTIEGKSQAILNSPNIIIKS